MNTLLIYGASGYTGRQRRRNGKTSNGSSAGHQHAFAYQIRLTNCIDTNG